MNEGLTLLTQEWVLPRVGTGVLIGYALRAIEHFIWWKSSKSSHELGNLGFCLMIIPQCITIGVAVGYLLLAVVALYFNNPTVVETSAYLLPALMSFLAVDVREMLRRISRI